MNKHEAKSSAKQGNEEFSLKPTIPFMEVSRIPCQLFKLHYAVCGVPRPWLPLPFSHEAWAILLITGPLSLGAWEARGPLNTIRICAAAASGPTHTCGLETSNSLNLSIQLLLYSYCIRFKKEVIHMSLSKEFTAHYRQDTCMCTRADIHAIYIC